MVLFSQRGDILLLNNRSFVFPWGHIGEALEAFGEILGIVKMEQVGDLRNIIMPLSDQLPCFLDFKRIVVVHNALTAV